LGGTTGKIETLPPIKNHKQIKPDIYIRGIFEMEGSKNDRFLSFLIPEQLQSSSEKPTIKQIMKQRG